MNPNFESIGSELVKYYYTTFDTNRAGLSALYRDTSLMTWMGEQHMGIQNIMKKITELPFQTCQHQIANMDSQPTTNGGIITCVSGFLKLDADANPLPFCQTFHLLAEGSSWYVANDTFRLVTM